MTNIFNVTNKTTKLSTLLFTAAFSIIAAASADASRNTVSEPDEVKSGRGISYGQTGKTLNLRKPKVAWERKSAPTPKKRKASVLEERAEDTARAELMQPPAKRICTEENRDGGNDLHRFSPAQNDLDILITEEQHDVLHHFSPVQNDLETLQTEEQEEESTTLNFGMPTSGIRTVPTGVMEVVFDEESTSGLQPTPTLFSQPTPSYFAEELSFTQGTAPIYDFGLESFTSRAKRTVKRHATKRNLTIAGGIGLGVVGGLALADYFFTGGVATATVATLAPSIPSVAQNVTSVAFNASTMCPVPSFFAPVVETMTTEALSTGLVPYVAPYAPSFASSFAQTVAPEVVASGLVPYVAPYTPSFASSFAQTAIPEVVTNGLVPYVAPYTTSFVPSFAQTVAPEVISTATNFSASMAYNASGISPAPSFLSPVMETVTPVAPEAARSIFWGFSNMIFGPNH